MDTYVYTHTIFNNLLQSYVDIVYSGPKTPSQL